MTPVQLPEVPEYEQIFSTIEFHAAMKHYATEAVMAERARIVARVADLSAWLRSGNEVPADLPFVFRERWQKIVADIRALETLLTPSETNSER